MADVKGPAHGISLPQYIGIPTTKYVTHTSGEVIKGINDAVQRIQKLVKNDDYNRIIIPCHTDKKGKIIDSNVHGLGKGVAVVQNGDDQELIQKAIDTAIEKIKTFVPASLVE